MLKSVRLRYLLPAICLITTLVGAAFSGSTWLVGENIRTSATKLVSVDLALQQEATLVSEALNTVTLRIMGVMTGVFAVPDSATVVTRSFRTLSERWSNIQQLSRLSGHSELAAVTAQTTEGMKKVFEREKALIAGLKEPFELASVLSAWVEASFPVRRQLAVLQTKVAAAASASKLEAEAWVNISIKTALAALLTSTLIGLFGTAFVIRHVARPLDRGARAIQGLADGQRDVTIEIPDRHDEIGAFLTSLARYKESLDRTDALAQELKEQHQQLDAAMSNMPHGLSMFDSAGRLLLCNPRYAEMYRLPPRLTEAGIPLADILAFRASDGTEPDDLDAYLSENVKPGLRGTTRTFRCKLRDGRTISISYRPLASGGSIASHEDITEAVQFELALARSRVEAERAREDADKANAAKTEFLARMSHEIRTPLNGILGYTDILLYDGALTTQQNLHVGRIQSSGAALLTIVNDILDFSKIEAGQLDLNLAPFALGALIDNATSIIQSTADKKRIGLRVELAPELPKRVVGDEDRLRQVLLNLLNNAVKFTPSGEVVLHVQCAGQVDQTCRLRFTVTDTGIGIPRDKQDRLFQHFSQVDGSVRREFGGTGLGLAISKRLIEAMKGEIGVESAEGEGSTFWVEVSLAAVETDSLAPMPPEQRMTIESRPARILLAEDNEINQEIACAVLRGAGHEVDVVANGTQAILAVQAETYDLVLMDVQMPLMDGITATQRIRELDQPACDLPIIAMTANVLPQQVAQFGAAGMDAHIGKPFKKEELYEVVERWSRGRTMQFLHGASAA